MLFFIKSEKNSLCAHTYIIYYKILGSQMDFLRVCEDFHIKADAERASLCRFTKKGVRKNRTPSSKQSQRLLVLLIVTLCVAAHKLIHTTCGVNQLHLTSVERVRCVRDFHLVHRIGFAVHFDVLFCRNGGPAQKHVVIRHILECHQTIIFWVNTFLHVCNVFELNAFSDCKGKQFIFTDKHFARKITIICLIFFYYSPYKAFDNFPQL